MKPEEIITELLKQYPSQREFARAIGEDAGDIIRWRQGKCKIKARAIISICRLHTDIKPHALNPELFPADLRFTFGDNI
jgi:transcriptional regulator with XRE-family HTH domain